MSDINVFNVPPPLTHDLFEVCIRLHSRTLPRVHVSDDAVPRQGSTAQHTQPWRIHIQPELCMIVGVRPSPIESRIRISHSLSHRAVKSQQRDRMINMSS